MEEGIVYILTNSAMPNLVKIGMTCLVEDERNVTFRDEKMSLTRATRIKLDNPYNVAPGNYWIFKGKKLREIYNETYRDITKANNT